LKPIVIVIFFALLSGCAVQPSKSVDVALLKSFDANATTRSIEVSKLLFAIPEGKAYGRPHGGLACIPQPIMVWKGGSSTIAEGPLVAKVSSTLAASGLKLAQARDELFSTPDKQAELVLGGRVVGLDFSTCGEGTFTGRKGSAYVSVEWQVFSRIDNRVIYSATTEGSYKTDSFVPSNNWVVFVGEALEAATKNLIAKDEFRAVLQLPTKTGTGRAA
jgi:serine protease Do